ncbi:MAG TPA: hypothetical protein VHQ41_02510 [Patescibacteria group bacterium]|jgi:hypothetical protein|nr:hypothetical protein [Patescibacteria group bacterium]
MNEFIEQFLKMFNLVSMGWKPFILVEYYPTGWTTSIYMTIGRLHGPVHVSFQGDNVVLLSSLRPVQVTFRRGGANGDGEMTTSIEKVSASFHMADIRNFPVKHLGHRMTRQEKSCRLFCGKEVQNLVTILTQKKSGLFQMNSQREWELLSEMYKATVPYLGMLTHEFTIPRKQVAGT